jgi:hypothetical protein
MQSVATLLPAIEVEWSTHVKHALEDEAPTTSDHVDAPHSMQLLEPDTVL